MTSRMRACWRRPPDTDRTRPHVRWRWRPYGHRPNKMSILQIRRDGCCFVISPYKRAICGKNSHSYIITKLWEKYMLIDLQPVSINSGGAYRIDRPGGRARAAASHAFPGTRMPPCRCSAARLMRRTCPNTRPFVRTSPIRT